MKCLISIGLILPALAAVIGVAAWAVSADVVMNSGNNNRVNKADNSVLQNFGDANNDDRRDIFRTNGENQRVHPQDQPSNPSVRSPSRPRQVSTSTVASSTLSPKEATDVNAILSKLISASGAASGGSGPRFVVVAPLPDTPDIHSGQSSSPVSRADHGTPSVVRAQDAWQVSRHTDNRHDTNTDDLVMSASLTHHQVQHPPPHRQTNEHDNTANKMGPPPNESASPRRVGDKSYVINLSTKNHHRHGGFNPQQMEMSGFDPFDSMFQPDSNVGSSVPMSGSNPSPNYAVSGPYSMSPKRGPPQGFFSSRVPMGAQHYETKDQHVFNPHATEHKVMNQHGFKGNHPPGMMHHQGGHGGGAPYGLKPIQQQMLHLESNAGPPRVDDSNRWGNIGFHGPPAPPFVHKPPEGISLSISSPSNSGTHVSAEPVSVIKSFFLPFLPKPRLNMNARVVFGVVLDKGMGLGGNKKDAGHRHPF